MIDKDRWFWCDLCEEPVIVCPYCDNSSCNGSGCDKCREEWAEVSKMFEDDTVPAFEDIPKDRVWHSRENLAKLFKEAGP